MSMFRSYAERYASPSVDVQRANYQPLLANFAPTALPATQLLTQVLGSTRIPQTLVTVAQSADGEPKIYLLHRPVLMAAQLGETSNWDGQIFATIGEVMGTMVITVRMPNDPFVVSTKVRVKSIEQITEWFATHPDAQVMEPIPTEDGDSEELTTRNIMYLPCICAPSLLRTSGYSPRAAWHIVIPLLADAGLLDSCKVFIDWLRVVVTLTPRRNPTTRVYYNTIVVTRPPLQVPMMDEELHRIRESVVEADLPGRFSDALNTAQAIVRLADACTAQRPPIVNVDMKEKEKSPSQFWPQTFPTLLRFTESADEAALPELYTRLAKAAKRESRLVIQEAMLDRCNKAHAYSQEAPIITKTIATIIADFDFVGGDPDAIHQGFHPLIINNGTAEQRLQSLNNAIKFDLLEAGTAAMQLQDLNTLLQSEVKHVPTSYMDLETCLAMFGDMMVVVLGSAHSLSLAFATFWSEWGRSRSRLANAIDRAGYVKPVHVLRRMQLLLFHWFDTTRRHQKADPVSFVRILVEINLGEFRNPMLPPALFSPNKPEVASVHTGTTASLSDGSSLSGTTVSSITTSSAKLGASTIVVNPKGPDATMDAFLDGVRIREVIKGLAIPINRNGKEMCVAYHGKGRCYSTCGRGADHAPHNAVDGAKLLAFITDATTKYKAQRQTAATPSAVVSTP